MPGNGDGGGSRDLGSRDSRNGDVGDVLVIGSVNRDLTVRTERFPAPGETVLGDHLLTGLGGKGANQAVAAAGAGARTRLLATVGDDAHGTELLRALAAAGVGTAPIHRAPGLATGTALITVDHRGENQIVVVPGANAATGADRVREEATAVAAADVVVVQGEIPVDAVVEAVRLGPRLTVLNLAPYIAVPRPVLQRVDVLVVNATEAGQVLSAAAPPGVPAALDAVRLLAGSARNAVITLGADGAVVAGERTPPVHLPVPEAVEVVDATGAGDAFVGVLAARLAAGEDLAGAVAHGVAAASRSVRVAGAAGAAVRVPSPAQGA
ncbi:ribokinase [Streptomyces sp. TS71-3]|uniref:ribokinase n=1 Tax=Streptomyces sp. TS71-3 TaxID=2733862 RepID=UPI001AFD233B|nr:ribokinase [Streptomyces sp. TS71-3]GHJ36974.1 ribokinase [Streptomyces sp. TS71-3]